MSDLGWWKFSIAEAWSHFVCSHCVADMVLQAATTSLLCFEAPVTQCPNEDKSVSERIVHAAGFVVQARRDDTERPTAPNDLDSYS